MLSLQSTPLTPVLHCLPLVGCGWADTVIRREAALCVAPTCYAGCEDSVLVGLQSASQPRLSYAEMAEDYPRYPDIHDLDLTLLNPRMIVVRRAVPLGQDCRRRPPVGPARTAAPLCCWRPSLAGAKLPAGNVLSFLRRTSLRT